MPKLFKNPNSDEEKTADQWAAELDYKNGATFRVFLNKCTIQNREADAFAPKEERKRKGLETSIKVILYTNPIPNENGEKESKTAAQWADHFGLSKSGWLGRVRKFGAEDPRTYETKEEAAERKKKAIMATRGRKSEKRGPAMPYTRRRGQLAKLKIGAWEEKNVPDRWAHLAGEP